MSSQITILKKRPLPVGQQTSVQSFWRKTARGKVQKGKIYYLHLLVSGKIYRTEVEKLFPAEVVVLMVFLDEQAYSKRSMIPANLNAS